MVDFGAFFQSTGEFLDQATPVVEQGLEIAKKVKLLKKKKGQVQYVPQYEPGPAAAPERPWYSSPVVIVGAIGLVAFLVLRRR